MQEEIRKIEDLNDDELRLVIGTSYLWRAFFSRFSKDFYTDYGLADMYFPYELWYELSLEKGYLGNGEVIRQALLKLEVKFPWIIGLVVINEIKKYENMLENRIKDYKQVIITRDGFIFRGEMVNEFPEFNIIHFYDVYYNKDFFINRDKVEKIC
jgi:hypothetical protein